MNVWLKDAAERVVVTFLEALLAVFTLDAAGVVSLSGDWKSTIWVALTTAGYALIKAVIAKLKAPEESASLVKLEP
jgi:hypothetical protein